MSSGWGPYLQKEEARRNLYHALASQAGVVLFGYKPDTSDPWTDYYSPESWDGIATYGEYVIAVDISPYDVESYSGQMMDYYSRPPETFPVFQANPKGRTWHVEQGGVILASGVGLTRCTRYGHRKAPSARDRDRLIADASTRLATKILSLCDRLAGEGRSPGLSRGAPPLTGMEPMLSRERQP